MPLTQVQKSVIAADVFDWRYYKQNQTYTKDEVDSLLDTISGSLDDHNEANNIQGGTTDEYYHLTANEESFIAATSDRIDIGTNTSTYMRVDNDDNDIEFDISNSEMFKINSSGVRIGGSAGSAPIVNEILESINDSIDGSSTDAQLATTKLIYDTISGTVASAPTQNPLNVGVEDTVYGTVRVFGQATGSDQGGRVIVETAADWDGGIPPIASYVFQANQRDLNIGRIGSPDDLEFIGSGAYWRFSIGDVWIGVDTVQRGSLVLAGHGSLGGGISLKTQNSATAIGSYLFRPVGDDMLIGPDIDPDSLMYLESTGTWQFTGASGIQLATGAAVNEIETILTDDDTHLPTSGAVVDYVDAVSGTLTNTPNPLNVGTSVNTAGVINAYGDGTSSTTGGLLNIQLALDHIGAIDTYKIQAYEDDLYIGPNTDPDALKYNEVTNAWNFKTSNNTLFDNGIDIGIDTTISDGRITYDGSWAIETTGAVDLTSTSGPGTTVQLTVGSVDVGAGIVEIAGMNTGSVQGGKTILYTAFDHDDTINDYRIQVSSDDLLLGPDTDPDALKYDGGNNRWVLGTDLNFGANTVSGTGDIYCGFTYYGDPTTSGTWRAGPSGENFVHQKYNGSTWDTKQTISG